MRGTPIAIAATLGLAGGGGLLVASGRLDRQGPALRLGDLPAGAVARSLDFDLEIHDAAPGIAGWAASVDGLPADILLEGGRARLSLEGLASGPHLLEIAAWDQALRPNWSRLSASFDVDARPPVLTVSAASLSATQGQAHRILLRSDEALDAPDGQLGDQLLRFYPLDAEGRLWRALVGVAIEAPAGLLPLRIDAADRAGNHRRVTGQVAIAAGRFPRAGLIQLRPDQVAARKDEAAKARMRAERDAAYDWEEPAQLWSGPMRLPVEGARLSSAFGRYRSYSDGRRSHHTGTDLAAPTGTPVLAANGGEVRFSGEQAIFGKVVILHHGQGLASSYNHLSRIDVKLGDRVSAGQVIGAVGSTGQSTGPHLHWGVTVGRVAVDPMPLVEDDLGLPEPADWVGLADARED